jgi:hypothetical protein
MWRFREKGCGATFLLLTGMRATLPARAARLAGQRRPGSPGNKPCTGAHFQVIIAG